ncbi:DNA polymerase III subunit psi, partial [Enterobacter hormaechei]|uniref:DNA polymerase III subunit psi n=1 Tax=Enterobacter hormaechei TaxID=158836 RepID=UPI002E2D9242
YIPAHVRLVMVAEAPPALNEPLIEDVLRSLKVTHDQVLQLAPDIVAMLPPVSRCDTWRIGAVAEIPLDGSQIS